MPKKNEVIWSDISQTDLASIVEYIAGDNPLSAEKIYYRIKKAALSLEMFPDRGRIVPEFKKHFNVTKYREIVVQNWRIIYSIENRTVNVNSVIDSRRNFEEIILERYKRSR